MRNFDSWGLYITMFMFLVGLSASGLIISSVPRAFGMKGFGGISKIADMDVHLLHGAGRGLRGDRPRPAPSPVGSCSRTPNHLGSPLM